MATVGTFQPGRLRLARELESKSQADLSGPADVTPAAISQFESGDAKPSSDTLGLLARALDVPVEFLCLPMEETHEGFFRSLRKSSVAQRRRARSLAHLVHDLAVAPEGDSVLKPLSLPRLAVHTLDVDSPLVPQAARMVRSAWGLPRGPVPDVVAALEGHGVLVLRLPLDAAEVDAFSLPFPDRPVVVLSADKGDRGRSRFDAAHELGHLVMHGQSVWGVKEVETQAHKFAAEFLMPADDIRAELPARADWAQLFELKQRWHVSIAALLMRAKDLEVMSPSAYTTAMKGISARGWRRSEPIQLGVPEGPTITTHLLKVANANATWFPRALMPALERSICSYDMSPRSRG
ncbi:DNA-binding protein [Terrabacter tumescens]|uniref:DNA-binding protein n=1 Tax=Terrabacter tumescens TaxID=60443 RepID=A0ABQ2I4L6_9MICO|nr:XRE family transcriptional regulator [Terrabacter tumescens]GGM99390.1 DNA-binding protein [Terrabacter tumescens]